MKRCLMVAALLILASCATLSNQTPQSTVYALRGLYDSTVLAPAAHYASLPRCASGVSATLAAPCSDANAVVQLQKADAAAAVALDAAESQVRNFPTIDATSAIAAAQAAINAATQILTIYAIK